jgi:hypothetical protein
VPYRRDRLAGDHIRGLAVHIGARVGALARAGEVLVSSTVKDLTAGSGLVFEDAGEHELKGVPTDGICTGCLADRPCQDSNGCATHEHVSGKCRAAGHAHNRTICRMWLDRSIS